MQIEDFISERSGGQNVQSYSYFELDDFLDFLDSLKMSVYAIFSAGYNLPWTCQYDLPSDEKSFLSIRKVQKQITSVDLFGPKS